MSTRENKQKKNPTATQVRLILHEGAQTAHVHFDRDCILSKFNDTVFYLEKRDNREIF